MPDWDDPAMPPRGPLGRTYEHDAIPDHGDAFSTVIQSPPEAQLAALARLKETLERIEAPRPARPAIPGLDDAIRARLAVMADRWVRQILVATHNHDRFGYWCAQHEVSHRDPRLLRLRNPMQVEGRLRPYVLAVDWPDRFDHGVRPEEMRALLRSREAVWLTEAETTAWLRYGSEMGNA